jgi:cytochrome b
MRMIRTLTTAYEGTDQRGDRALRRTLSVRVWDLPTRVMHWSLAAGIAICWWTGVYNELQYHLYSGYAVLWIALMRIYWGLVGSSTARFVNFVRGPRAIVEYVRTLHLRRSDYIHGHNALGAISVLVMLGLVLGVVGLGLFAVDVDGLYSGPLSVYVDFHTGRHLAHLHYRVFKYLLLAIGLHILAVILYYAYKRHNLILPMISGRHPAVPGEAEELHVAPLWRLAVGAAIVTGIVWATTTSFYF